VVGTGAHPRAAGDAGAGRGGRALIRIVCVGKPRGPLADAAREYETRLGRALRLEVVEVREEPLQQGTPTEVMERERRRLEPHLEGFAMICLDRTGRTLTSAALADELRRREEQPPQRTAFIVGGSCGLAPALTGGADLLLSFGPMTLPHQLARVVLAEQLYRATTILRGEPYHR
jgi:23S rRNA (pseudouridine1915-N3)-methyltransferase